MRLLPLVRVNDLAGEPIGEVLLPLSLLIPSIPTPRMPWCAEDEEELLEEGNKGFKLSSIPQEERTFSELDELLAVVTPSNSTELLRVLRNTVGPNKDFEDLGELLLLKSSEVVGATPSSNSELLLLVLRKNGELKELLSR